MYKIAFTRHNSIGEKMVKNFVKEIIITVIGASVLAFGVALFLLPNQLSSGGVSGIATITYYLFNISMGKTILIINIPLFLFATYKLGAKFTAKSIVGTASLSIFIDLFDKLPSFTDDRLLASIYGGILVGLGTAIVFKGNSSTGGTDLFTQIMKKYNHNIRMGSVVVIVDVIIVGLNVIFFKQIQVGLYSTIAIYLSGKMIDIVFEGVYFTKLLFIISDKTEEIAKEIAIQIGRGTTRPLWKGHVHK
jgi:uncharacterized membrane-anchored protein YitT (DUF2179 family)